MVLLPEAVAEQDLGIHSMILMLIFIVTIPLFYAEEQHCKAVEIEWDLPTSKKGLKKFLGHPKAYVDSQIKRRQVEVRERTLSPEEAIQFTKAKHTEVRNFIAAECLEKAKGVIPD